MVINTKKFIKMSNIQYFFIYINNYFLKKIHNFHEWREELSCGNIKFIIDMLTLAGVKLVYPFGGYIRLPINFITGQTIRCFRRYYGIMKAPCPPTIPNARSHGVFVLILLNFHIVCL